jgi:hypothetical protein
MKTKKELISELEKRGYSYEFVFNNLTKIEKRKIIEFLFIEKNLYNQNDVIFDISSQSFKKIALLIYDDKKNIVAMGGFDVILDKSTNLYFYDFLACVSKLYRLKGKINIGKYLFGLMYYESYDYACKNNLLDQIKGIYTKFSTTKIISHFLSKKFNDIYFKFDFSNGHDVYITYYPKII